MGLSHNHCRRICGRDKHKVQLPFFPPVHQSSSHGQSSRSRFEETRAFVDTDEHGHPINRYWETRVARDGVAYTREKIVAHYCPGGSRDQIWLTNIRWNEARSSSSHFAWVDAESMREHPHFSELINVPADEWDPVPGYIPGELCFMCVGCGCNLRDQWQLLEHRAGSLHGRRTNQSMQMIETQEADPQPPPNDEPRQRRHEMQTHAPRPKRRPRSAGDND